MRKRIFVMAILSAILVSGCSSASTATADNTTEVNDLKAQIEELKKENQDLKTQLEAAPEAEEETIPAIAQEGAPVSIGDTITTDTMEIKINNVEFSYDVLPDDTSSFYTHYAADEGNVYIHIDADVKNLGKQNLSCDQILRATADYNGGYTYSGQPIPEDNSTGFTYANIAAIKPLETLGVRFLIKCPQEVEESTNPLFITLEPSGAESTYTITVR